MKSKAPLLLMEQMVMLLVFALAAALCLQTFVRSDSISRQSEERDRAVVMVQSAAETIRYEGGTPENALEMAAKQLDGTYIDGTLLLEYDENWEPGVGGYQLTAHAQPSDVAGLGRALVVVEKADGTVLFQLEVAWQEVKAHG